MATPADLRADVYADPGQERLGTPANVITLLRTASAVVLAGAAVQQQSLTLLVASLATYWAGDVADGVAARVLGCETRIGATLDILSDRLCAAVFYLGLAWMNPVLVWPVLVYLAEFMVVDCLLSLAFLAWPIRSPNYFFVVDRPLWLWNWSKPGKALNSAAFAVLLLVTENAALGVGVAGALLALKLVSLVRLVRIGVPLPPRQVGHRAPLA